MLFSRIKGTKPLMTSKPEKEVIYAPGGNGAEPVEGQELLPALDDMTPREIVAELDKYIVGQTAAKRAVAVALRNRVRRQKLPPEIAEDVLPKNILMIGPTGVGKTEIARRLARLAGCPFVKVEASKYTEVGYVGRDVESMVRDLVETSIDMIREEKLDEVADRAEQAAEERVLDLLLPPASPPAPGDRKSTRLNSSHGYISYAVFCLKKKKTIQVSSTSVPLKSIASSRRRI